MQYIFCPWCGDIVTPQLSNHRYDATIRPSSYEGPKCIHGHPDVACVELARTDTKIAVDLLFGVIRAGRAALLAERYGQAPRVADWVRPCGECRSERAKCELPILRHELALLAKAVSQDMRLAERRVDELMDAAHAIREASAELAEIEASLCDKSGEPHGFVYLIGHADAVKIGWSRNHPVTGGRLSGLQVGTHESLELLGLLVGPYSLESQLHDRFSTHNIRGEWFMRCEEILTYFEENGIAV